MSSGAGTGSSVAVVGAGSLGVGWAIVFARAGIQVAVTDPDAARLTEAIEEIGDRLGALQELQLLDEPPSAIRTRVRERHELADAVAGVAHVQECAPEDLELKRAVFRSLEEHARPTATLASSSSALTASAIAGGLTTRERCIVLHPANPPYLLPVVEVVPAPFTRDEVVVRSRALLEAAGMEPVEVHVEIEGAVFNRLQGAVLREAYCLVRDGVATVEDVDRVVRDGLARRWSVVGPFETADLNTRGGIEQHAARMGPAYERMGAERGQHDPWTPELVARVTAARRGQLPLEEWGRRVQWRDRALMALEAARRRAANGAAEPGRGSQDM